MAAIFTFHLAGQTYGVSTANNFYLLPSGEELSVQAWPAWCYQCQAFAEAELLRTVEELASELTELEYFRDRPGLIPEGKFLHFAGIPACRLRITWRASRTGPARCLECGSSEIVLMDPGPDVDIPGIGMATGEFRGWADKRKPLRYYTSEGTRTKAPAGQK